MINIIISNIINFIIIYNIYIIYYNKVYNITNYYIYHSKTISFNLYTRAENPDGP